MTFNVDSYDTSKSTGSAPGLDLGLGDDYNLRVLRSEFARMMGVSKPTVTEWAKTGWITIGADNRIDPRQAVASLLKHRDPARIRSKVLAPLINDIAGRDREIERLRQLVEELRHQLAAAKADADFEEASAAGILGLLDDLKLRLRTDWPDLAALPGMQGPDAVVTWIECAAFDGTDFARSILDYIAAPGETGEGGGAEDAGA
jgi:hypothetical protein